MKQLPGTLIYNFNGISIYQRYGIYTVTDGNESVSLEDQPCFDHAVLRQLLAAKKIDEVKTASADQSAVKKQSIIGRSAQQFLQCFNWELELQDMHAIGY